MTEPVIIAVVGGLAGVGSGFGIAFVIRLLVPGLPYLTPPAAVVAALVMSADKAKELSMKPLGHIRDVAFAGFDPSRMGISPVFATHKILKQTGMKLTDMELIELNEAFAAQVIACERGAVSKEFFKKHLPGEEPIGEIRRDILNVNGGAIALGHPVGSSGLRIIVTLLKEMERRNLSTGLATICIGGGQGGATVVERR